MADYHTSWTLNTHDKSKPIVTLNLFHDEHGLRLMLDEFDNPNHYGLHIADKGDRCAVSEMCMIDGSTDENKTYSIPRTLAFLLSLGIEDVRMFREKLRLLDKVFNTN